MNAYELADIADHWAHKESAEYLTDAASMLRQQADRIKNLLDVIEAQKNYMKAQDEHIVDLAFKLVYAERGNEVARELDEHHRPD